MKPQGTLREVQGEPHTHIGTREGPGKPQGMLRQFEESQSHTGSFRTPWRRPMNRLPGHSSSNPNEGIEGIESLLDRQLYLPLRENLVWPGR